MVKELIEVKIGELLEKLNDRRFFVYKEYDLCIYKKSEAMGAIEGIKRSIMVIRELIYLKKFLKKRGYEIKFEKNIDRRYWGAELHISGLNTELTMVLELYVTYEKEFEGVNTLEDLLKHQKRLLKKQQSLLKKLEKNKILIRKEFKDLLDL